MKRGKMEEVPGGKNSRNKGMWLTRDPRREMAVSKECAIQNNDYILPYLLFNSI